VTTPATGGNSAHLSAGVYFISINLGDQKGVIKFSKVNQ
jgi:hypothetical protein